MQTLTKEQIRYTAVFAAIWSVFEITAGTFLHLAKVPFRGFIMSLIAAVILVIASGFINYKGAFVLIGAVAATFKAVTIGGLVITPVIAIFLESVLAEVTFIIFGSSLLRAIIAGALVVFYTFVHGILAQLFFFGMNIYKIYSDILSEISTFADINGIGIVHLLIGIGLIHILFGIAAGLFGRAIAINTKRILADGNKVE